MSHDVSLMKDGKICEVPSHEEGGTYALGGLPEASLNITYNYSWFYYHFLDKRKGLKWLYGKSAKETIPRLEKAVKTLGDKTYEDYWVPTPGNAGHALSVLLSWAKLHPEGIWEGD